MTIGAIQSSRRDAPDRIFLMGVEGVGKSTFGSEAPDPVFISSEDGIRHLDAKAFPEPEGMALFRKAHPDLDQPDDMRKRRDQKYGPQRSLLGDQTGGAS